MRAAFLAAAMMAALPAFAAPTITPEEIARIAPPPKPHPLRDARIAEVISYGASAAHTMDYYKPTGTGPHPAVVIVHGGGWVGGTKRSGSEAYAADWLAPAGYAVFSIDYRLAPAATWADQVADVQRAIRFVRHNAGKYTVDPARIAVLGGSAGGYLSNMVGLLPFASGTGDAVDRESDAISAVVTLFGPSLLPAMPGVIDIARKTGILGPGPVTPEKLLAASPMAHLRADAPPFLLIHGDADEAVPYTQSTIFLDALNGIGVRAELITIPNGKHATSVWTAPNVPDWERETVQFLNAALHHDGVPGPGIIKGERP